MPGGPPLGCCCSASSSLGWWFFRVKTSNGMIELVNLPKDAEVLVDGEEVAVTWPGGGKPAVVTVTAGKHKIMVKKDGLEISGDEVTVQAESRKKGSCRAGGVAGSLQPSAAGRYSGDYLIPIVTAPEPPMDFPITDLMDEQACYAQLVSGCIPTASPARAAINTTASSSTVAAATRCSTSAAATATGLQRLHRHGPARPPASPPRVDPDHPRLRPRRPHRPARPRAGLRPLRSS